MKIFRNRSFNVKMVKDPVPESSLSVEPSDYEDLVRTIAKASIVVVAVYFGGDTLRKIMVHVVSAKIK